MDYTFYIIDCFFLVDMVLTFFTSVTDTEKMLEITDLKIIAKKYFEMWFWIDFISIFPFDEFGKAVMAVEGEDQG